MKLKIALDKKARLVDIFGCEQLSYVTMGWLGYALGKNNIRACYWATNERKRLSYFLREKPSVISIEIPEPIRAEASLGLQLGEKIKELVIANEL